MTIDVQVIGDEFAAEIDGVDCRANLTPSVVADIAQAVDRYAVVIFREQALDDVQQLAFSQHFGFHLLLLSSLFFLPFPKA